MRIPEQRYRCPLGQLQSEARMDPEAIKREGWRDQRILVLSDADDRLDFVELRFVRCAYRVAA